MAALESELVSSAPIPPPETAPRLTHRQKLFIRYYLQSGNGADAARKAGYSGNADTLSTTAYDLIRHPYVSLQIKRLCDPIADTQEVLERMTMYSRSSIADVLNDSGSFDLQTAKNNGSDALIKKLKFDKETGNVTDLEIHDAKDATLQLARVHGLLNDKLLTENTLDDTSAMKLAEQLLSQMMALAEQKRLEVQSTQSVTVNSLTDGTSGT